MTMFCGIDGAKRKLTSFPVGIDGATKHVKELWAGIDGAKRKIFSSGIQLGSLPVGTIIKLNEKSIAQNYLIVHQGIPSSLYDVSCNGTWILRNDILVKRVLGKDTKYTNIFNTTNSVFNDVLSPSLDQSILSHIKEIKIPYCVGGEDYTGTSIYTVNSGENGYPCKMFILSGHEVGFNNIYPGYFPVEGAKLDYFVEGQSSESNNLRISHFNGSPETYATRTRAYPNGNTMWQVEYNGDSTYGYSNLEIGIRPAMVMDSNLIVDDNGNIIVA